jgi:hypothetical protein
MHRAPQSWVSQQVLQSAGYWLVHPFPQPPSEAAFYASVLLPTITQVEFTSSLQLSLSRLFLQGTCLTVFRLFATQGSHAVKDFFIFDGSFLVSILPPLVPRLCGFTRAERRLPGAWLHTPGGCPLSRRHRSRRSPSVPRSPWHGKHIIAWGVPFSRP